MHGYEQAFTVLDIDHEEDALGERVAPVLPDCCHGSLPCGLEVDEKNLFRIVMLEHQCPVESWATWDDVPDEIKTTYEATEPGMIAGWEE